MDGARDRMRVVALVSGGDDGELAARMLESQGVDVVRVHFDTGFVRADRRRALGLPVPPDRDTVAPPDPRGRAVRVVDVRSDYLREVVEPARDRRGHGPGLDACRECRTFLARRALAVAREVGAAAVATGDVVGQHPRSQSRAALEAIAEDCGAPDALVRPLCARRLAATAPERDGRIDRGRLGDAHGRARAAQRRWARAWGLAPGPHPGGRCCALADPAFAGRVRDLLAHAGSAGVRPADLDRLRVGRHVRLDHRSKAIVARDAAESAWLRHVARPDEWVVELAEATGPTVLVEGPVEPPGLRRAAGLAVRFAGGVGTGVVRVSCARGDERRELAAEPVDPGFLEASRL